MSVDEKLGVDKFHVNEDSPHITLNKKYAGHKEMELLVKGCPAGLYKFNKDQSLSFDYAGCLECGTCRVLALGTVIKEWNYPLGSFGVEFRFG